MQLLFIILPYKQDSVIINEQCKGCIYHLDLKDLYVECSGRVFQQTGVIQMGTNFVPLFADLCL